MKLIFSKSFVATIKLYIFGRFVGKGVDEKLFGSYRGDYFSAF